MRKQRIRDWNKAAITRLTSRIRSTEEAIERLEAGGIDASANREKVTYLRQRLASLTQERQTCSGENAEAPAGPTLHSPRSKRSEPDAACSTPPVGKSSSTHTGRALT